MIYPFEAYKDVVKIENVKNFLAGYGYIVDKVIQIRDAKGMVYTKTTY